MSDAFITNGRIIDPANNIDEVGNLSIVNGKVKAVGGGENMFPNLHPPLSMTQQG